MNQKVLQIKSRCCQNFVAKETTDFKSAVIPYQLMPSFWHQHNKVVHMLCAKIKWVLYFVSYFLWDEHYVSLSIDRFMTLFSLFPFLSGFHLEMMKDKYLFSMENLIAICGNEKYCWNVSNTLVLMMPLFFFLTSALFYTNLKLLLQLAIIIQLLFLYM